MSTNTNIFLKGDSILPNLYMDMILVESTRPILFTCIDSDEKMFICSCHCADSEKCEWIIVDTTPENVINLLLNKVTIREIFDCGNGSSFIVTLCGGRGRPLIQKVDFKDISDEILPTNGYYMDAEDGEFDVELTKLRERLADPIETVHMQDSFIVSFQNFNINMSFPDFNGLKVSGYHAKRKSFPVTVGV